jgi:hypothetical protein
MISLPSVYLVVTFNDCYQSTGKVDMSRVTEYYCPMSRTPVVHLGENLPMIVILFPQTLTIGG